MLADSCSPKVVSPANSNAFVVPELGSNDRFGSFLSCRATSSKYLDRLSGFSGIPSSRFQRIEQRLATSDVIAYPDERQGPNQCTGSSSHEIIPAGFPRRYAHHVQMIKGAAVCLCIDACIRLSCARLALGRTSGFAWFMRPQVAEFEETRENLFMLASSLRGFLVCAVALEFAARARLAAEELVMRRACPMNIDGGVGIACLRPDVGEQSV